MQTSPSANLPINTNALQLKTYFDLAENEDGQFNIKDGHLIIRSPLANLSLKQVFENVGRFFLAGTDRKPDLTCKLARTKFFQLVQTEFATLCENHTEYSRRTSALNLIVQRYKNEIAQHDGILRTSHVRRFKKDWEKILKPPTASTETTPLLRTSFETVSKRCL